MFTSAAASAVLGLLLAADQGPAPDPQDLQLTLSRSGDAEWQLTRVDLVIDGEDVGSVEVSSDPVTAETSKQPEPCAAKPPKLWSGQVAPGPHELTALLFFRPRLPVGGELVKVESRVRFDQPIHPLVLLITPVRPRPAPPPPDPTQLSFAPAPRPL